MKKYEAVFILDIRALDDEGDKFSKELADFVESLGGKMLESKPMGRKQFMREIDKRKAGIYWNYVFEVSSLKVNDIKEKFRRDERIVRSMTINYDCPEQAEVKAGEE